MATDTRIFRVLRYYSFHKSMIVLKQPSNACATLMFHFEFNIVVKAFKIVDGLIGFCFYFVLHILLINE